MKHSGKVLKIVWDIFVLIGVVLEAWIYCDDILDITKHWFDD